MTTAALPVVRGPVPLAKALAALDILSGGRLIVGVSPGSSARDYALAGIAFEERWKRFDEVVQMLRCLLRPDAPSFNGNFYVYEMTRLEPFPVQESGPPIWIGSWGSDVGLHRVARLGDGWLASAFHITPESFADGLARLHVFLEQDGRFARKGGNKSERCRKKDWGKAKVKQFPFNLPIVCPIVIGRTAELTALHLLLERAKSGTGQVVLLSGEAGIGKSRLAAEAKTDATAQGFLLLQSQCFPTDRSCPCAPLLELLRSHFATSSPEQVATEMGSLAPALSPLLPDLLPRPSDLPPLPPLAP